ncbi:hypothetical protein RFI_02972 [Reticulomyxa filosa]|uniref:Uncharacterized protein n=1 Tax=Reticulomyxa filosa TaxID=46433 RepID=X6P7E1_RETFI|nr:hypothetical protein RFI_02972 [Reticulomyxa filosa]|eukprot:ETO34121.1 hypothetical protein RFI_02972 [Reticulomyxa filosa]
MKKKVQVFFFKEGLKKFIYIKMEQLQDSFSIIEKEFVSKLLNLCKENFEEATKILTFLKDNKTTSQQQLYLIQLLETFGNKINKTVILNTWKQSNQIFADMYMKLKKISSTYNINEIKENNELKIMREICLYILWNIISHPKIIKYRQININSLYQILKRKCYRFNINVNILFEKMQSFLEQCGFQKENNNNNNNNNWYYHFIEYNAQLLWLWECYEKWIYQQPIYKTRINIPKTTCMLLNGKWKEYVMLFDYEYRRIILMNKNNLKIKTLTSWKSKKIIIGIECSYSIEFNSFQVILKGLYSLEYREPLNPYSMTLRQGLQYFKQQLQVRSQSILGEDELVIFECAFDKCEPQIPLNINEDEEVHWKINYKFMTSYKHSISIERIDIPKSIPIEDIIISSNRKPKFNPLLYECDIHKLKIIQINIQAKMN